MDGPKAGAVPGRLPVALRHGHDGAVSGHVLRLHEWIAAHFGFGVRTIALIDTMADSPLGQVAMIPTLAWIAKEAPPSRKATYFAVFAAFTNLALAAGQLGAKYLNRLFVIERGRYDELGLLMIVTTGLGLVLPVLAVWTFRPGVDGWRQHLAERLRTLKTFLTGARSRRPSRQEG